MDFVCKVGTPSGEVVERVFAATDEASLRADLEQQGFYLFGIRRGLQLGALGLRRRSTSPSTSCWSDNAIPSFVHHWRPCAKR